MHEDRETLRGALLDAYYAYIHSDKSLKLPLPLWTGDSSVRLPQLNLYVLDSVASDSKERGPESREHKAKATNGGLLRADPVTRDEYDTMMTTASRPIHSYFQEVFSKAKEVLVRGGCLTGAGYVTVLLAQVFDVSACCANVPKPLCR